MNSVWFSMVLASVVSGGALLACSSLTAPPDEVAVGQDTTTAATVKPAAKPKASASARPSNAPAPSATIPKGPEPPLTKTDVLVGKGQEAKNGDRLAVHYRGTLTDGKEFDSSYKRSTPFEFVLGQGQVIKGWDQGVLGMKVGGKRKLVIPPSLGYGDRPAGTIPPGSTLNFEVELVEIKK
jgi:peptidylprolyl isomerase